MALVACNLSIFWQLGNPGFYSLHDSSYWSFRVQFTSVGDQRFSLLQCATKVLRQFTVKFNFQASSLSPKQTAQTTAPIQHWIREPGVSELTVDSNNIEQEVKYTKSQFLKASWVLLLLIVGSRSPLLWLALHCAQITACPHAWHCTCTSWEFASWGWGYRGSFGFVFPGT